MLKALWWSDVQKLPLVVASFVCGKIQDIKRKALFVLLASHFAVQVYIKLEDIYNR